MKTLGTLKIWIGLNSPYGIGKAHTLFIERDIPEIDARVVFTEWQKANPHIPDACAMWTPAPVIFR